MRDSQSKTTWLPTAEEDEVFSDILESRHLVVFPWLIEAIRKLAPGSVLDYGGGDGKFLAALGKELQGELWHYDPSPALTSKAIHLLRDADVRFCQDPKSLPDETIDVLSSVAVWMTLSSHQACLDYLREQWRLLRRGGSAFVAVTHPCFREERYSSFKTGFKNESYLEEGSSFSVEVFDRENRVQFVDYHWNLSTMLKQSREVGFGLRGLTELPDTIGGNRRGAPWLCFEFQKD
jgi:SAM-dependent methyltransferase